MIELAYLSCKVFTYVLIINEVYERKIKLDVLTVFTIATEVIFFKLTKENIIPEMCIIIPHVVLFLYCMLEFRSKISRVLINIILSCIIVSMIQLLVSWISFFIKKQEISLLLINIITFLISIFLMRYKILFNVLKYMRANNKGILIILSCGVLFLILISCFVVIGSFSFLEYLLIVVICILLSGFICIWKNENKKFNYKTKEMEIFNEFRVQQKQLYSDIRKKQHEFKNQLNAIYGTHYTCATYEELVSAQRKYADWIKKDNMYNDVLLSCKPSILAGFICNQLECAKEKKIQVEYCVKVVDVIDVGREYDYICVFGVLFDNAIDAMKDYPVQKKKIEFVFDYNGICTKIEVRNVNNYIGSQNIRKWFGENYSTKGENRGLGLCNLKDMKKKYQAEIVVENIEQYGENWISVCFIINDEAV